MPTTNTTQWRKHAKDDPTCDFETLIDYQTPSAAAVMRRDYGNMQDAGGDLAQCTCADNGKSSMTFKFALFRDEKTVITKVKLNYVANDDGDVVDCVVTHTYPFDGDSIVDVITGAHKTIAPDAGQQIHVVNG